MIDENETFKRFGYHSTKWARESCKKVVAVCDGCDLVREVQKRAYRDLCLKCACNTPERAEMLSLTHTGKVVSDEQKRKQSDKMSGRKQSEAHIKKRADALSVSWTAERKESRRQSMMGEKNHNFGKPKSPETLEKMRAAATGRTHSEETKDKMSETRKGVPKTDETRTNMSSAKMEYHPHRGVPMTLEERIGQSCGHQKIAVDDWDGFVAGIRDHVLPISQCTQINKWFPGCEGHHLSRSLVVFIPSELHNHIWHNMKTGLGMAEMNALALQFAF